MVAVAPAWHCQHMQSQRAPAYHRQHPPSKLAHSAPVISWSTPSVSTTSRRRSGTGSELSTSICTARASPTAAACAPSSSPGGGKSSGPPPVPVRPKKRLAVPLATAAEMAGVRSTQASGAPAAAGGLLAGSGRLPARQPCSVAACSSSWQAAWRSAGPPRKGAGSDSSAAAVCARPAPPTASWQAASLGSVWAASACQPSLQEFGTGRASHLESAGSGANRPAPPAHTGAAGSALPHGRLPQPQQHPRSQIAD